MKTTRLEKITCLTIGLILGITLSMVLHTDIYTSVFSKHKAIASTTAIRNQSNAKIQPVKNRMDSFSNYNTRLQQQLQRTKQALSLSRATNSQLKDQLSALRFDYHDSQDTNKKLSDCDSILQTAEQLVQAGKTNDSLCDATTINLQSQITIKDSTMALQMLQYQYLQQSFDTCITVIQQLQTENKLMTRHLRRQRNKSRWLSAGTALLVGCIAYSIVQQH